MKRLTYFLLVLIFLLTSCGSPASEDKPFLADPSFDTDEPLPDYDFQTDFYSQLALSTICASEDAYYFTEPDLSTGRGECFLWYSDKKTGISGKLCTRPECLHNDSNCNAYLGVTPGSLSFYDGKLYCFYQNATHDLDYMCISIYPDGTGRKTEMRAPSSTSIGINTSFIHRGYIYIPTTDNTIDAGIQVNTPKLYCLNIATGEMTSLFEGTPTEGFTSVCASPLGNDIYFAYCIQAAGGSGTDFGLYRIDSGTREVETCFSDTVDYTVTDIYAKKDDGIYMMCSFTADDHNFIGKYDFKTGEIGFTETEILSGNSSEFYGDKLVNISPDNESYETRERCGGVIYSLNGEKLAETATITEVDGVKIFGSSENGTAFPFLLGCDGKYVLMRFSLNNSTSSKRIYYAFPLDGSEPFEMWRNEREIKLPAPAKGK